MSCDHLNFTIGAIDEKLANNSKIYKDDCMYCFDTAENNANGLDICLQCYQGFSRGELNHTKDHEKNSGHSQYLNVIKKFKIQSPRRDENLSGERGQKAAKLEIKEEKEEDIYDIIKNIYCARCDRACALSESPNKIKSLAEDIIKATSSARNEEIQAWEHEVFPCEHALNLQQSFYRKGDLSRCELCGLKENLWICLHCGNIGCGRQQFGSTLPGNSHALEHFSNTGHPVAVKLGSLSSDENGNDCYCYQCNDEVKVPDLFKYLLTYDIDLGKAVKTEKNLIELNLDQNLNWDFKLEGVNGQKLEPVFGPLFTGFQNLGNSCYLNSTIQALFSHPFYEHYFGKKSFPSYDKVSNPSEDLLCQLLKIRDGLWSGRYSKPSPIKGDDYQLGIRPHTFKALIGENHSEFKTQRQQDAFEFLLYVLDQVDKNFGLEVNRPFKFLLGNKIVCSNCLHGTLNYELLDNISLPIETIPNSVDPETGKTKYKDTDIGRSLDQFFSQEEIEGYNCEHCQKNSEALKSCGFKSFPENLIVNSKRIQLQNWVPIKVDVPVEIPDIIDLAPYKSPRQAAKETLLEVSADLESDFKPNDEALSMLLSMDFPETRCVKALYHTKNTNAEEAVNWILGHLDDPEIDTPLSEISNASEGASPEAVSNLVSMGFSDVLSKKALLVNNNDISAAVEWLFSNPDDDGNIEDIISKPSTNIKEENNNLKKELLDQGYASDHRTKYALSAIVCHKGSSPHTGHYVVYIKKLVGQESKWVLFNDEKVVIADEASLSDAKENAYIYFFDRLYT